MNGPTCTAVLATRRVFIGLVRVLRNCETVEGREAKEAAIISEKNLRNKRDILRLG